jgi:hypothetical protein
LIEIFWSFSEAETEDVFAATFSEEGGTCDGCNSGGG